jgi:hypothetical protein
MMLRWNLQREQKNQHENKEFIALIVIFNIGIKKTRKLFK